MRDRTGLLRFICTASLAVALSGCGGLTERDQQLFDAGRNALSRGDWSDAEESFSQVLTSNSTHAPSLLQRAEARLGMMQLDAALHDVDMAFEFGLSAEEEHGALLVRAKTHIAKGRQTLSDIDFRTQKAHSDLVRRARDTFLAAYSALHTASDLEPQDFETNLWRGYTLYRQENAKKALEVIDTCLKTNARSWRANYFRSLILESLHGPNTQSFESAIELIEESNSAERLPVHLYLIASAPEIPAQLRDRIAPAVRKLLGSSEQKNPILVAYVEEVDRLLAETKRREAIDQAIRQADQLGDDERLHSALRLLNSKHEEFGDDEALTRAMNSLSDRWTKLLDLKAQAHLRVGDRSKLTELVEEYRVARKSTKQLELKITLQQKINDLQMAIAHLNSSSKMRDIGRLLKAGEYREVLRVAATLKADELDSEDQDLYHYANGAALYHIGEWTTAAVALSRVESKEFEDLDRLRGLALIKSGSTQAGIAVLATLPPQAEEDDANRALAAHFRATPDLRRALAYNKAIVKKRRGDFELAVGVLTELGKQKLAADSTSDGIALLEKAREILDSRLRRRDPDLYSLLGETYFNKGDLKRAKQIYTDLIDGSSTVSNRKRFKESFRRLGEIYLQQNSGALAYEQFREYIALGGEVPDDLRESYGRLAASFGDFMPLDRVHYWNYTSTVQDYNYTLTVKGRDGHRYKVERREHTKTSSETWERDGIYLTRLTGEGGSVAFRMPIDLSPIEKTLPADSYETGADNRLHYTTEVVAINQSVELPEQKYEGCLKIRVTRRVNASSGETRRTRYVIWLAPDVGEVRREVYQDEVKVAETILSSVVLKEDS